MMVRDNEDESTQLKDAHFQLIDAHFWGGQKPRTTDEEGVFCEHDSGTTSKL